MSKIKVNELTGDEWSDLLQLFGKSGAYWNCWCMYWRYGSKEFNSATKDQKIIALKMITDDEEQTPGLLAYLDERPVGWIGFSPKKTFQRLNRSRVIKSPDDKPAWSIVCFFIHTDFRNQGVATKLIEGTIEFSRRRGISIIESYPIENEGQRLSGLNAYYGTTEMFARAGFVKVADTKSTSQNYPRVIMRFEI